MSQVFYKEGLSPKQILEQKKLQKQYIQAEIDQNLRDLDRVKRFKETQGNIQTVSKFEKPLSEKIKDRNLQLKNAGVLLETIFEDKDEGKKALQSLNDDQIQKLNRYGPILRDNLSNQFENITADFFLDYFDNFVKRQEESGNLLNFYYPISININEEENQYEEVTGEKRTYKPYKGPLNQEVITRIMTPPQPLTREKVNEAYKKADQMQDRLIIEIKKLESKREKTRQDAEKVQQYADWLESIVEIKDFYMGWRMEDEEFGPQEDVEPTGGPLMRPGFLDEEGDVFYDPRGEENMTPEQLQQIADEEQIAREEALLSRGRGILKSGLTKRGPNFTFKAGQRPILGRGLYIEKPKESFVPFGKYIINYPQLEDGFLMIKYPSKGPLPIEGLNKRMKISESMKSFFIDVIEKKKVSNAKFNNLTNEEKVLVKRIFELAKLNKVLQIKEGKGINNLDEDMKRYQVILGEIKAGNTNVDLKRQLVLLLSKFVLEGRIKKEEGEEIIKDLLE